MHKKLWRLSPFSERMSLLSSKDANKSVLFHCNLVCAAPIFMHVVLYRKIFISLKLFCRLPYILCAQSAWSMYNAEIFMLLLMWLRCIFIFYSQTSYDSNGRNKNNVTYTRLFNWLKSCAYYVKGTVLGIETSGEKYREFVFKELFSLDGSITLPWRTEWKNSSWNY